MAVIDLFGTTVRRRVPLEGDGIDLLILGPGQPLVVGGGPEPPTPELPERPRPWRRKPPGPEEAPEPPAPRLPSPQRFPVPPIPPSDDGVTPGTPPAPAPPGSPAPRGGGGGGGGLDPEAIRALLGPFFDDPIGAFYEQHIREALDQLRALPTAPTLAEVPAVSAPTLGPLPPSPDVEGFRQFVAQLVPSLLAQPFTETEEQARRVAAFDALERARTAAQQRALERISAGGALPTSGTAAALQRLVDRDFDIARAQAENQLLMEALRLRDERRAQAAALQQALAQAGLQQQGLEAERQQAQAQMALQAALEQARLEAQTAALNEAIRARSAAEARQRILDAVGLAGQIPQYAQQQYQNALQALLTLSFGSIPWNLLAGGEGDGGAFAQAVAAFIPFAEQIFRRRSQAPEP